MVFQFCGACSSDDGDRNRLCSGGGVRVFTVSFPRKDGNFKGVIAVKCVSADFVYVRIVSSAEGNAYAGHKAWPCYYLCRKYVHLFHLEYEGLFRYDSDGDRGGIQDRRGE